VFTKLSSVALAMAFLALSGCFFGGGFGFGGGGHDRDRGDDRGGHDQHQQDDRGDHRDNRY